MSTTALLAWTLVAALAVMTPGLDTLLVLRHTMLGGRRAGLATVVGISTGCVVWATASLAGLTALLAASTLAYDIVRVAGAAYLVWLGAKAIWQTLPRNRKPSVSDVDIPAAPGLFAAFRTGVVTNLLNPKVGVFYMSLLPQFLPKDATSWGILLVAIHVVIGFVWFPPLIWAASRARALLLRDRVRRWLDRATATVLIGLGIKLVADGR
ncbi:LysE family translocator [Actinophytocola sp.]|uniref:LysE family translocator n=1 Tax=Actinophytocola sp. TaxID=1872138 RepID=UPI002ED0F8E7